MIEKIADDLIGQMTEARLIDKEMEARYVYVFICWIEKFITVGSIIVAYSAKTEHSLRMSGALFR